MTFGSSKGDDLDQWARGLKADLVVMGTCGEGSGRLEIDCRLVAPESGRSLGAAHGRAPLSASIQRLVRTPAPSNPVAGVFEAVVSPKPGGNTKSFVRLFRLQHGKPIPFATGNAPSFQVGELMGFFVRPPMDCRLYIFNYDALGDDESVVFIYPLPQVPFRSFHERKSYLFPACIDPEAVSYSVEPPLGRMMFKVIGVASDASHGDLVEGLDGSRGYYLLHRKDLKPLISLLAVLPRSAWWEESVEFWVMEYPPPFLLLDQNIRRNLMGNQDNFKSFLGVKIFNHSNS
ncbi:MAG: DUF4384 domain-containing protein [Deltaproteobacteria bacterium]|nr:DUF4384 domain-containing protein [Deltaproteobacteria bacterium]